MREVHTSVQLGQTVYIVIGQMVTAATVEQICIRVDKGGASERLYVSFDAPDPFRPGKTTKSYEWCRLGRADRLYLAAFQTLEVALEARNVWAD